jgi:hypothetical protein
MGLFTFMAVREGLITSRSGVLLPCGRPRPIQHAVASAKFAIRHPQVQAEPLWPWITTKATNIDRDLSQEDQPEDEFTYMSN